MFTLAYLIHNVLIRNSAVSMDNDVANFDASLDVCEAHPDALPPCAFQVWYMLLRGCQQLKAHASAKLSPRHHDSYHVVIFTGHLRCFSTAFTCSISCSMCSGRIAIPPYWWGPNVTGRENMETKPPLHRVAAVAHFSIWCSRLRDR